MNSLFPSKTSLVRTFDSILLPHFCGLEATFSFAVTSPASDRWHSGSQEELGEHIHLRPNSSGTSSISLSPPPPPPSSCSISAASRTFFTRFPDFAAHLTVSHFFPSDETSPLLFPSVTHSHRAKVFRIVSSWMPSKEENRHAIHEIKYFFFSFWMNYQSTDSYLLLPMISLASELWILALHQTKLVLCPGKHAHTTPISFTAVY